MDLVMTFKVTSNNIEKGREGGRNVFKFFICFRSGFLDGNPFFKETVSTIAQLPVTIA